MLDSVSWTSAQLTIGPIPTESVEALVEGRRLACWAEDFPTPGDLFVAHGLHRREIDQAQRSGGEALWGHLQVVERSSGLVVGGAGFHAPPKDGEVEIGYGIVPSRQGRGYATEAVSALVVQALSMPEVVAVVANTDADNVASQHVLTRAGFQLVSRGDGYRYRIEGRPTNAT